MHLMDLPDDILDKIFDEAWGKGAPWEEEDFLVG